MWENCKRILGIPIVLLFVSWILFNPHIAYVCSVFILNSTNQINGFCSSVNLSYRFSTGDILGFFRFLEYLIFGIVSINSFGIYFKKTYQNIINAMFLGLLTAVFEAYCRSFGFCEFEIKNILYSFFEFCIGVLLVYVFSNMKPKKRVSTKYKKNNYIGRG